MDGGITGHTGITYTHTANESCYTSVHHSEDWSFLLSAIHSGAIEKEAKKTILINDIQEIPQTRNSHLSNWLLIFSETFFNYPGTNIDW